MDKEIENYIPKCHVWRTFQVTKHLIMKKSNEEILEDFKVFQKLMFITNEYQYELTEQDIHDLFELYNGQRMLNLVLGS